MSQIYDKYTGPQLEGLAAFHKSTSDMFMARGMERTAKDFRELAETYETALRKRHPAPEGEANPANATPPRVITQADIDEARRKREEVSK
jgi:hypothetical protein